MPLHLTNFKALQFYSFQNNKLDISSKLLHFLLMELIDLKNSTFTIRTTTFSKILTIMSAKKLWPLLNFSPLAVPPL